MEELNLESRSSGSGSAVALIVMFTILSFAFMQFVNLTLFVMYFDNVSITVFFSIVCLCSYKLITIFTRGIYSSLNVTNRILTLNKVTLMLKDVTTTYNLDELVKIKKSNPYSFNQGLCLTFKNKKRVYIQFFSRGKYGYMSSFKFTNDKHPLYLEVLKSNDFDINSAGLGYSTDAYYDYFKKFIKEPA